MNIKSIAESGVEMSESSKLKASIHAFLSNLIDYAGLFPPANLSLDISIKNYKEFQMCKDSWMLGRFIIPISQLNQLTPYVSMFSKERPLIISTLGSRSNNKIECLNSLHADLEVVRAFHNEYKRNIKIDICEIPLPPHIPDRALLQTIAKATDKSGLQTFCEATMPLDRDWKSKILETLDIIAAHNNESDLLLGFKLRTGGVTAEAFPTSQQVATVLVGCRDRDIPLKFTAGLHHPIRMYREEVNTQMHGFLNVFTAGMLAYVKKLDIVSTVKILADEKSKNFKFTDKGLQWHDLTVPTSEIIRLREKLLCSYGSCSFDEPREDLRTLGIYSIEEDLR
ncbi:hypothetical protein M3225_13235 [Priestia aryabhattai]|uniref:hypothetical protein n=1 Tax=Priestia aryabhattai TaxID=412384 RepID=UPI00203C1A8C|nr:hypothetical protein [Priestia aryabhattai]MCM3771430.1 hypothetical protein [Priestia aryabhattai]